MKLHVQIQNNAYQIEVPNDMLSDAEDFFRKMDRDMDQGWQISREFVENPNPVERCQIAADRLYTAIESENRILAQLMAGYILKRMPGVSTVNIDICGDIQTTEIITDTVSLDTPPPA